MGEPARPAGEPREPDGSSRSALVVLVAVVTVVVLVAALVLYLTRSGPTPSNAAAPGTAPGPAGSSVAVTPSAGPAERSSVTASTASAPSSTPSPNDPPVTAAPGGPQTFDVELFDTGIRPTAIAVPQGSTVVLRVRNTGEGYHDLAVEGGDPSTPLLAPGASQTITVGPVDHPLNAWCRVPMHKAAGMLLSIGVEGTG